MVFAAASEQAAKITASVSEALVGELGRTIPIAARRAALNPERSPGDLFEVRGSEVYLGFPRDSARSKLSAGWLERSLGVTSTWRNWSTIRKLAELVIG